MYATVLKDLTIIRGDNFSRLFDLDIGRTPRIRNAAGDKDPKYLINNTCDELKTLQEKIALEDIDRSGELVQHLRLTLPG